jgi:hypothetical protein
VTQVNGTTSANNASTTTTIILANTKEKTPMCLVNELARFNTWGTQPFVRGLFLKGSEQCTLFAVNFLGTGKLKESTL